MQTWQQAVDWAVWFSRIDGHRRFVYRSDKYGWVWRFSVPS